LTEALYILYIYSFDVKHVKCKYLYILTIDLLLSTEPNT
jgi:hypothetical protein